MNINHPETWTSKRNKPNLNDVLVKGTALWGSAYAIGASLAACLLASVAGEKTLAFSDVLMDALWVFPLAGGLGALAMWRLNKAATTQDKLRKKPEPRNTIHRFKKGARPGGLRSRHAC